MMMVIFGIIIVTLRKTGRYPTIPVAFELCDDVANSFQYKINQSTFERILSDVNTKVGKFNRWFPQEVYRRTLCWTYRNFWWFITDLSRNG